MYLIDGNNVMGQRPGWHRDRRAAQLRLLSEVAELSKIQGTQMSVIFDGKPLDHFPDGSRFRGVFLFFARHRSTADDRIIELIEASRNRHNLTVVTSDRALMQQVQAEGVKTIRSGEFRKRLDSLPLQSRDREEVLENVRQEELGGWLRYFGVDADDDCDQDEVD